MTSKNTIAENAKLELKKVERKRKSITKTKNITKTDWTKDHKTHRMNARHTHTHTQNVNNMCNIQCRSFIFICIRTLNRLKFPHPLHSHIQWMCSSKDRQFEK